MRVAVDIQHGHRLGKIFGASVSYVAHYCFEIWVQGHGRYSLPKRGSRLEDLCRRAGIVFACGGRSCRRRPCCAAPSGRLGLKVRPEAFKSASSNPLVSRSESLPAEIQNLNGKREIAVISGRALRPLSSSSI
jgi:hypothetical protein